MTRGAAAGASEVAKETAVCGNGAASGSEGTGIAGESVALGLRSGGSCVPTNGAQRGARTEHVIRD